MWNQRAAAEDFAFLKTVTGEDPCPEYGGFNMKQARETGKQAEKKTTVLYTPFLDITPAKHDAMKTAMACALHIGSWLVRSGRFFYMQPTIIQSCGQYCLAWDGSLLQICANIRRYMHCLMGFVGAVRSLMAGSDLEDILKSKFACLNFCLVGSFQKMSEC